MKITEAELTAALHGMYVDGELEVFIRVDGEVLFHVIGSGEAPAPDGCTRYRHPDHLPAVFGS